jgi:hypothetical protein
VVELLEGLCGSQKAGFVHGSLAHTAGMPRQRRRERESTPLDCEGIGH